MIILWSWVDAYGVLHLDPPDKPEKPWKTKTITLSFSQSKKESSGVQIVAFGLFLMHCFLLSSLVALLREVYVQYFPRSVPVWGRFEWVLLLGLMGVSFPLEPALYSSFLLQWSLLVPQPMSCLCSVTCLPAGGNDLPSGLPRVFPQLLAYSLCAHVLSLVEI